MTSSSWCITLAMRVHAGVSFLAAAAPVRRCRGMYRDAVKAARRPAGSSPRASIGVWGGVRATPPDGKVPRTTTTTPGVGGLGRRGDLAGSHAAAAATATPGDGDGSAPAPNPTPSPDEPSTMARLIRFLVANYFLVGMLVGVALAYLAPSLGATGGPLRPEFTVNQVMIRAMFLISGLNLPLTELKKAVTNVKANALIQAFIFGLPAAATAYFLGPALKAAGVLTPRLVDGLVVLACLPTTIGSGVALTTAAEGNVAVSLFHAVFSNLAGIFITPALIFFYLGADCASVGSPYAAVTKLTSQVLVPVVIGMGLRAVPAVGTVLSSKPVKGKLKLTSDCIILVIIWNTFCNTFSSGFGVPASELTSLFVVLSVVLVGYKASILAAARAAGLANRDAVSAVYMGSQKTLAFGLPLIKALFEGSPELVWFCLPALMYHPMQIALGSALVPRLREFANAKRD